MLKRSIAYIFLFLASFVLLAHAVVPHHHHNNQVCIVTVHEHNEHCTHHESDSHIHHQNKQDNHNEKDDDCCQLKKVYVIPASNSSKANDTLYALELSDRFSDCLFTLNESAATSIFQNFLSKRETVYPPTHYSLLFGSAAGLRAPPIA